MSRTKKRAAAAGADPETETQATPETPDAVVSEAVVFLLAHAAIQSPRDAAQANDLKTRLQRSLAAEE